MTTVIHFSTSPEDLARWEIIREFLGQCGQGALIIPPSTSQQLQKAGRYLDLNATDVDYDFGGGDYDVVLDVAYSPDHIALMDDEAISELWNNPHYKVEWDASYFGGDYNGTGEFAYIPKHKVLSVMQADELDLGDAIEQVFHTTVEGASINNIIHYCPDELWTEDGDPWEHPAS